MNRIIRTRSQHFVSSPRKQAAPPRHKLARHSSKRRRVGPSGLSLSQVARDSDGIDDSGLSEPETWSPRPRFPILSSEAGLQAVNRSRSRGRSTRADAAGRQRPGHVDGYASSGSLSSLSDAPEPRTDTEEDSQSPRKRKRGQDEPDQWSMTSGSWVETDGEEELPEFIAESA